MKKLLDNCSPYAHWLLRLSTAAVFLYHGLSKFPALNETATMMMMPVWMVLGIALFETLGALLLLFGGFTKDWVTRLGVLLLIPVMLGAIIMVHWGQWNFMATETHPMGGMEFQVTLLSIQLFFLLVGNRYQSTEVRK